MKKNVYIIGISGGTGSGKTCASKNLYSEFPSSIIDIIEQDSYYKDLKHLTIDERNQNNFDHPNSIDFNLMDQHLNLLISDNMVEIPVYDYKTHTREKQKKKIVNKKIIIIEGIFSLYNRKIRDLMDLKIYVDTPADIRIIRRIKRDVNKRKREFSSIIKQYLSTVRPMHEEFVEPTKKYADIILINGGKDLEKIKEISTIIKMDLSNINAKSF